MENIRFSCLIIMHPSDKMESTASCRHIVILCTALCPRRLGSLTPRSLAGRPTVSSPRQVQGLAQGFVERPFANHDEVLLHFLALHRVGGRMGCLLQAATLGQAEKSQVGNFSMAAENYCRQWQLSWLLGYAAARQ